MVEKKMNKIKNGFKNTISRKNTQRRNTNKEK